MNEYIMKTWQRETFNSIEKVTYCRSQNTHAQCGGCSLNAVNSSSPELVKFGYFLLEIKFIEGVHMKILWQRETFNISNFLYPSKT